MTSKLPASWERELHAQRTLRTRIERLANHLLVLRFDREAILSLGGKGWVTRLGDVNIEYDATWQRLRTELAALHGRNVPT